MLGKKYQGQDCALASALEVLGERWTLLIIRDAFYGVCRFSDFQAHLDIPKAVLASRLSGLVTDGIFQRLPDPQHAGRSRYTLTAAGRELWPALYALLSWGDRHRRPNSRLFQHAACGTTLSGGGYCAACQQTVAPQDIISVPCAGHETARTDPVAIALRDPRRLLEPIGS